MWKKRPYTNKWVVIQTQIAQMTVKCLHLAVSLNEAAEMFCSVLLHAYAQAPLQHLLQVSPVNNTT